MAEIVLKLIWALLGEELTEKVQSFGEKLIPRMKQWFYGLPLPARITVGVGLGFIGLVALALIVFGTESLQTAQDFMVAERHPHDLFLTPQQRTQGTLHEGVWTQTLLDRYDQQLTDMREGKVVLGGTTWTVAQKLVALEGIKGVQLKGQDALEYFTKEIDHDCGCWRGFYDPDGKRGLPLQVGLSAWIITAVQGGLKEPQPAYADFLKKAQLRSGAWPVLRATGDRQGSTFATPWAIMALINLQARMPDHPEIAAEIRKGVTWLLDSRESNGLWQLYPQGTTTAAHKVSLSNSGLALVALHRALRAEGSAVPEPVLAQWTARIALADRELLRHLKPGLPVDENESYNDSFPTLSDGIQFERMQLLVLPWLVMGAVQAYPAGNVEERMKAVAFFDDFGRRLADFDKQIRQQGNEWRIAEMLMAVRAWLDHNYPVGSPGSPPAGSPGGAPATHEQASHNAPG